MDRAEVGAAQSGAPACHRDHVQGMGEEPQETISLKQQRILQSQCKGTGPCSDLASILPCFRLCDLRHREAWMSPHPDFLYHKRRKMKTEPLV